MRARLPLILLQSAFRNLQSAIFMRPFNTQEIKDDSQVGAARRAVHRFASRTGLGEEKLSDLDIVVQEIATNAVRYATSGGCLHWRETPGKEAGIEFFYEDKGPGIYDLERALRDGVSTGGGLGSGFGAMRRLLDEFDAFSVPKGTTRRLSTSRRTTHGTVILGRKWADSEPKDASARADA